MKRMSAGRVARYRRLAAVAAIPVTAAALLSAVQGSASGLSFSTVYVDPARGGGEPFVIYSHAAGDLVYSSHEGTTLTQSSNVTGGTNCDINVGNPFNSGGYICSYHNQVEMWFSHDAGHTWTHSVGDPVATGFSDPSLTEDNCVAGACNIWNTGIDLANDALFASSDGGQTWVGTPQCPPGGGDRPWLAGGQNGEVFLVTNANVGGHTFYHGTITGAGGLSAGAACNPNGITDSGGAGQIYYNHHDGSVIEPRSGSGHYNLGVLPHASTAWPSATGSPTGSFMDPPIANGPASGPGSLEHWPSIAISTDTSAAAPAGTVYLVWDTAPRDTNAPHNGCSGATGSAIGGNTLLPGSIKLAYTNDEGQTWSAPITIANPGTTVMWPWVAAGANGNVSVVWYQADQLTDPDCDSANLVCQAQTPSTTCPTNWSIQAENLYGLTSGSPTILHVTAVHDPVPGGGANPHPNGTIHVGKVCEGGTTCAATGEDRRLGDYFTNALDQNGCVMIASGDTMQNAPLTNQPLPNSLPIFAQQTSGPSLTTGADCSGLAVNVPEVGTIVGLAATGTAAALLTTVVRRRRLRATLS